MYIYPELPMDTPAFQTCLDRYSDYQEEVSHLFDLKQALQYAFQVGYGTAKEEEETF